VVAALLGLVTACSVDGSATRSGTAVRGPDGGAGTTACDEVVRGIDAFNDGQLEETVRHFELAEPLAASEADAADSRAADDLLEAVRYYADLPPEDYLEAAASSPEFARYKAITLGLCAPGPPGDSVSESPPAQLT